MNRWQHIGVALVLLGAVGQVRVACADNSETITITPDDFRVDKPELLEQLADLESIARLTTATADYAQAYEKFTTDLGRGRVPLREWSAEERDRVKALPAPPEEAWQALDDYRAGVRNRIDSATRAVTAEAERLQEQRRQQAEISAERTRAEQETERARLAAQQQMELWRDINRGSYWYYPGGWGGGWHGHHPGHGHGHGHHHGPRQQPRQNIRYGGPGSHFGHLAQ